MNTFHFPDTAVCLSPWPPLEPSHSCTFPALSPVLPYGYSTALVLVAEHSDAAKSTLCCQQLSSSRYHWSCSVLQELCHVQSEIPVMNNNVHQLSPLALALLAPNYTCEWREAQCESKVSSPGTELRHNDPGQG